MRLLLLLLAIPLIAQVEELTNSQKLFYAISKVENCRKWNNPGCLKFAHQKGANRGPNGYAVFKSKSLGEEALAARIEKGNGMNVGHFLRKYNPGKKGYVKKVLAFAKGLRDTDTL